MMRPLAFDLRELKLTIDRNATGLLRFVEGIVLVHVFEYKDPVALGSIGRWNKFADACIGILPDRYPCSFPWVIPMGFDVLAGKLIHVNADEMPKW